MFLVTTGIECTWPDEKSSILFLGKWCIRFDKRSEWEKIDFEVADYHWDDRTKLIQDYEYLQDIYDRLLPHLTAQLNSIHGVQYSIRYWRIVVGPWLNSFIQIVFDRWAMIHDVFSKHEIDGVRTLHQIDYTLVPNDMSTFASLFVEDAWNEFIYTEILDWLRVPSEKVHQYENKSTADDLKAKMGVSRPLFRSKVKSVINRFFGLLSREKEYFIISSYMGYGNEAKLQLKLLQIPKLWTTFVPPISAYNPSQREWSLTSTSENDKFTEFLCSKISRHLPMAYLEGYKALDKLAEQLPWPKAPKAIFTSDSWSYDEVFKVWAAAKVEQGSPLVIGQHGGGFGVMSWVSSEVHQILISDVFLTWGWRDQNSNKVTPVGMLKRRHKRCVANYNNGLALLVCLAIPRYSYNLYSTPVSAGQWESYFQDQCDFVDNLSVNLRDRLVVRLYPQDLGLDQNLRWRARYSDIHIDDGKSPIVNLMKIARIFISTYNATTFLESLSINFPTLMFWNPLHWELRDSAVPDFEILKSVGIFHDTPESAARHLSLIWDDIQNWWESSEVQNARSQFCGKYAHLPDNQISDVAKILSGLSKSASNG